MIGEFFLPVRQAGSVDDKLACGLCHPPERLLDVIPCILALEDAAAALDSFSLLACVCNELLFVHSYAACSIM